MFQNMMFNSRSVANIPSTTNGGEMANTGHARQTVRKSRDSATAAQDRRVRRTRAALRDAFLALVSEKGYEKITIQDILDRADVGRSTFYVHYRAKEALLIALFY